jgi:subtilase family protein
VAMAAGTNSGGMSVLEQRYVANNRLERSETGTSFASPQVAGAAALLYGAGLTDPLVIKAVLLDSTTLGRASSSSAMGTQEGWLPDWGWGELNLDSAYQQRTNFVSDGVGAQDVRFYRATVAPGDRATLVWNRRVVGPLVQTIPPQTLTLSNLDLFEYDSSQNQQASSTSAIDNVEQVRALQPGTVIYKVKDQSSTVDGLSAEPFALAATNSLTPVAAPTPSVTLTIDGSHVRQGDDVTLTQTVTNTSSDLAGSSSNSSLDLPAGVTVTSGGSTTWAPGGGTLAAGASGSHQWTIAGTADGLKQLTAHAQDGAYGETFSSSDRASITVDSTPPTPSLACPENVGTNPQLALSWTASDASPISSYDVDVSVDNGPYVAWRTGVPAASATYSGEPGHSYGFRVRATDDLGNVSDYTTCEPVTIGFAPMPPPPFTPTPGQSLPAAPHLRLTSVRLRHGHLVIRGRVASRATGSVTGIYTLHGRKPVRTRASVRSGAYRLSLRIRARRGVLTVRYSGDRAFATQRVTRRIR